MLMTHYIPTDHSQTWTGSAGANYVWWGTRFSADMIFGSGLRSGFANLQTVPAYAQINVGVSRPFKWSENAKPLTVSFSIVNLLDFELLYQERNRHWRIRAAIRTAARLLSSACRKRYDECDRAGARNGRCTNAIGARLRLAVGTTASLVFACLAPAAFAGADEATANAPIAAALLPSDLSPWGMFLSADVFVKAVMVTLAFASFVTWTVALAKAIELMVGARKLTAQIGVLERSSTIADARGGASQAAADWRRPRTRRSRRWRVSAEARPRRRQGAHRLEIGAGRGARRAADGARDRRCSRLSARPRPSSDCSERSGA